MYSKLRRSFTSQHAASSEVTTPHGQPNGLDTSGTRLEPVPQHTGRSGEQAEPPRDLVEHLAIETEKARTFSLTRSLSSLIANRTSFAQKPKDQKSEKLGLHVLAEPSDYHGIDLVFVHGLGGTCRFAWSKDKDLSLFWPKEWLPSEHGFQNARILTFGYNAYFKSAEENIWNISDFAKSLLLHMKVGSDEHGKALNLGQVPILFVVHSMGGLVVKKACILGSQDPQFHVIFHQIRGIVFLATPHRGSSLAETLNKVLVASLHSSKLYVGDLQRSSSRISDINDQFKHLQSKIRLVSFFETRPTPLTLGWKAIVVERDSAILDYPTEISAPLDATHTSISKFSSRTDANYVHVRDVVRHQIEKIKAQGAVADILLVDVPTSRLSPRRLVDKHKLNNLRSNPTLSDLLDAVVQPAGTLERLWEDYTTGSCDWILSDTMFSAFLTNKDDHPMVLQISGRPGSGKSMMASFLAKHLEELSLPMQLWYFRHDTQPQRSNRECLLSLALQMVNASEEYAQMISALGTELAAIARSDNLTIWKRLFIQPFINLGLPRYSLQPWYWVIDALDESESSGGFLNLLNGLKALKFPLRIIFLSRLHTETSSIDQLKSTLGGERFSNTFLSTPENSLRLYISKKLEYVQWAQDLKDNVIARLIHKSEASFLWLSLVLGELVNCDTREQLEITISETPAELISLYSRIESTVCEKFRPADRKLVQAILAWVSCAERPLLETELNEALRPEFSVLNWKLTISRLFGDFLAVDKNRSLIITHYTAKEYLLQHSASYLAVNSQDAHTSIFNKCFTILTDPKFRIRLKSQGCTGFLRYCCLFWSHHLARSNIGQLGKHVMHWLAAFFTGSACLTWIHGVASVDQLQVLTSTSKALVSYLATYRRMTRDVSPLSQPIQEMELVQTWSSELVRIVGKFGTHLIRTPTCIYAIVPLFSPANSMINRLFSRSSNSMPRICGLSNDDWDDSLANFTLGEGQTPKIILCHHNLFGIITSDKAVAIFSTSTFQSFKRLHHDERLVAAHFNIDGTLMVTGGLKSVKVWDMTTGQQLHSFSNPDGMRAMEAVFSIDSSEVIVCCIDSKLRRRKLWEDEDWVLVQWQKRDEADLGRGGGTPSCVAFNPDGSQIAISHRTVPLTVWDTQNGNRIGMAMSRRGRRITHRDNVDYPVRMAWCPGVNEHVVGIYTNGTIFKWNPADPQVEEMVDSPVATEIACSPDGRFIVTAQRDGSLKILSFDNFQVLYNLKFAVRAHSIAMSPDGRRIYDLRQSFCNIWEPHALIPTPEEDELGDAASSLNEEPYAFSLGSTAISAIHEPVTAIALSHTSSAVLAGTVGGKVRYESDKMSPREIIISPVSISCLALGRNGTLFAASSIDNRVVVQKILSEHGRLVVVPVLTVQGPGPITQLLFGTEDETLLISAGQSSEIWSLTDSTCLGRMRTDAEGRCRWILHPYKSHQFILVKPISLEFRSAAAFEDGSQIPLQKLSSADNTKYDTRQLAMVGEPRNIDNASDEASSSVSQVLLTPRRSYLFMSLSRNDSEGEVLVNKFFLIKTKFLTDTRAFHGEEAAQATPIPQKVSSLIWHVLGFVRSDAEARTGNWSPTLQTSVGLTPSVQPEKIDEECSLAFIDHEFWVCSWSIDALNGATKRHFFLPQDWINLDCLRLSAITPDGRFICPRNGEVATLHHALKVDGVTEG